MVDWQVPVAEERPVGNHCAGEPDALSAGLAPEGAVADPVVEIAGVHQVERVVATVRAGQRAQITGDAVCLLVHIGPVPERGRHYGLLGSGRIGWVSHHCCSWAYARSSHGSFSASVMGNGLPDLRSLRWNSSCSSVRARSSSLRNAGTNSI